MSKASDYAAAAKPRRPVFADGIADKAHVDDEGRLFLMGTFSQRQARKLARWILDTFDEEDRHDVE